MGFMDGVEQYADDLAAGDEVRDLAAVLSGLTDAIAQMDPEGGEPFRPTDYSTVPDDSERLAVPAGTTTIDFEQGRVTHPDLDGTVAEIKRLEDMSGAFDGRLDAELRSVYAYADTPTTLRFNGGGTGHVLDSCNYYPIRSQGFKTLTLNCPLPFEFSLSASTRRDAFDTSGVSVHMDRLGERTTTTDDWETLLFQPHALHDDHGTDFGKGVVHVASFARSHLFIENTAGNGNAADIRVLARNNHPGSGTFYPVKTWTGVADGDHVSIDIAEKHHFLKVQVRNNAAGSNVTAESQMIGGAP